MRILPFELWEACSMATFPGRGTLPPLRELPGLIKLASRVARSHLGGRPTAATMCVVVHPDGRIAFVKASYRAHWSMPGGYCDAGEAPAAAAEREVREETGLVLSTTPRRFATRDLGFRVDHFFIATCDPNATGEPTTGWEIAEFRWATWAERPLLDKASAFVSSAVGSDLGQFIANQISSADEVAPR